MDSRYYRPSSPRSRAGHPARSSTGTFAEPYYDPSYYPRAGASSPRSSAERIAGSHHSALTYNPASSSTSRAAAPKYDVYSGRRRRNTLETDERLARPVSAHPIPTSIPVRAPGLHSHHDPPSSPLARSWDTRGDTYITHGASRREHKKLYSVDDSSHSTKLVAEKDVIEPRRRESGETRGYSVTSGGRSYHQNKPLIRSADLGDDGYSFITASRMFDETEPAWRTRSGSMERSSRPTSMIMDRAPRASDRALGPPPSTRGFDKINNGIGRNGSGRDHHIRSSSHERSRDVPKYDSYSEGPVSRTASTRHHAPAIHQEPRGRDTYKEEYERRDSRDMENRRHNTADRFEDREVVSRGFGIAPVNPSLAHDHHVLDRQPVWNAAEVGRGRPDEYGAPYYPPPPDRSDVRIPEPRMPDARVSDTRLPDARIADPRLSDARLPDPRVPDARASRERDVAPTYDERPRERDRDRRVTHADDRSSRIPSAVAGVAAGAAAATYGANEILKSRERDRERDRDTDKERERRKERDERERRDRGPDDRREWAPEDRRDRPTEDRRDRDRGLDDGRDKVAEDRRGRVEDLRDRLPEERAVPAALPPATAAFALAEEAERKARERRHEDVDRDRRPRKASPDDSSDERPRHYVDRDAARESERRKEAVPKEAALDPDEEYRRRIQLEAERSGIAARDRDPEDRDRDRERRRHRDERDISRDEVDDRSRGAERSGNMLDTNLVQEPDSLTSPAGERDSSRSVQIVAPPKEPQPAPKGILRKPTEKFPEHPEPIREGVAPHKSQLKGKDIPVDARWTKIDRRLVNPEALEAAKERFEERIDCVIVLRVLTKAEIQKLADRTKEIRQAREDEYELREREHDRRSHRSHRDDEDRDRDHRRDDDSDDDYLSRDRDRDRERDRERDRPRTIEAGR